MKTFTLILQFDFFIHQQSKRQQQQHKRKYQWCFKKEETTYKNPHKAICNGAEIQGYLFRTFFFSSRSIKKGGNTSGFNETKYQVTKRNAYIDRNQDNVLKQGNTKSNCFN